MEAKVKIRVFLAIYISVFAFTVVKNASSFDFREAIGNNSLQNFDTSILSFNGGVGNITAPAAKIIHTRGETGKRPLYLAHRGSHRNQFNKSQCVANTVCAFNEALSAGFDGFEFDLWITKDKKFIISHGRELVEQTNCIGLISSREFKDLVAHCTMTKPQAPTSDKMRGFKDILDKYLNHANAKRVYVDLKPGSAEEIVSALRESFNGFNISTIGEKFFFEAPSPEALSAISKAFPQLSVFYTSYNPSTDTGGNNAMDGIKFPDDPYLDTSAQSAAKYREYIKRARDRGKEVLGWNFKTVKQFLFLRKNLNNDLDIVLMDGSRPPDN